MLQLIKKIFFLRQAQEKQEKKKIKKIKNTWAERQMKEMGKLGGKLILM